MIDLKYGKRRVVNYRGAKKVIGGLTAKNKIAILLYIAKELANLDNRNELSERILELCSEIFEPDNVTLRIWDRNKLRVWGYLRETNPPRRDLKFGEGFSGAAFASKETKFYADLSIHPELIDNDEETMCVMCVPILGRDGAKGTISIESNTDHFYVRDDIEILEAMAAQIALALDKVQLVTGLMDATHRLENDMKMGRNVQNHIVNHKISPWNGLYGAAYYRPMVEVSGDYFDAVAGKDHLTILLADVSGHGVPAALITMVIHYQFRRLVDKGLGLKELMGELNSSVRPKLPAGTFFTAQILRVFPDFQYAFVNGGHQPVLQIHYEEFNLIDAPGLPLGIEDTGSAAMAYEETFGWLRPGDFLIMSSDGFHEQRDAEGNDPDPEAFTNDFMRIVAGQKQTDAQGRVNSIVDTYIADWEKRIGATPIDDDLSLLCFHLTPESTPAQSFYETARKHDKAGDLNAALADAHRAYQQERTLVKNLNFLANRYYKLKNYNECIRYLQEYMEVTGDTRPETMLWLGMAYYQSQRLEDARIQFKRALSVSPGYSDASLMLVRCYKTLGQVDAALDVLDRALKYAPRNRSLLNTRSALIAGGNQQDGGGSTGRRRAG